MSTKVRETWTRAAAVATCAVALTLGAGLPARAADDGEAPIWTGLYSVVGPYVGLNNDDKPAIEYRERSKLVVPPKKDLPKPGSGPTSASWPVDQDKQVAKRVKALKDGSASTLPNGRVTAPIVQPGAVVTMSATSGTGPGVTCLKDGVATACPESPKKTASGNAMNWNPLTWVGIEKKPDQTLGPEPERDFLTDPPPGYRAPVEGPGAKVKQD